MFPAQNCGDQYKINLLYAAVHCLLTEDLRMNLTCLLLQFKVIVSHIHSIYCMGKKVVRYVFTWHFSLLYFFKQIVLTQPSVFSVIDKCTEFHINSISSISYPPVLSSLYSILSWFWLKPVYINLKSDVSRNLIIQSYTVCTKLYLTKCILGQA